MSNEIPVIARHSFGRAHSATKLATTSRPVTSGFKSVRAVRNRVRRLHMRCQERAVVGLYKPARVDRRNIQTRARARIFGLNRSISHVAAASAANNLRRH